MDFNNNFITYKFQKNNQDLENSPVCGMTLRKAGSMRFRWNEKNENRNTFLDGISSHKAVPVELIHSQTVYTIENFEECLNLKGDGIITTNKNLMPVVTVADCVPLYFFDAKNYVFGIVHSGWKGTGIIQKAFEICAEKHGTNQENFYVIIGPHIHDCCYIVNEQRAEYFKSNFAQSYVRPLEAGGKCYAGGKGLAIEWDSGGSKLFRLSLLKANLSVLEKIGIPNENIRIINECTCCNENFGSNRRETAIASKALGRKLTAEEAGLQFTVQAAFVNL